jgi:hypothetical protein
VSVSPLHRVGRPCCANLPGWPVLGDRPASANCRVWFRFPAHFGPCSSSGTAPTIVSRHLMVMCQNTCLTVVQVGVETIIRSQPSSGRVKVQSVCLSLQMFSCGNSHVDHFRRPFGGNLRRPPVYVGLEVGSISQSISLPHTVNRMPSVSLLQVKHDLWDSPPPEGSRVKNPPPHARKWATW